MSNVKKWVQIDLDFKFSKKHLGTSENIVCWFWILKLNFVGLGLLLDNISRPNVMTIITSLVSVFKWFQRNICQLRSGIGYKEETGIETDERVMQFPTTKESLNSKLNFTKVNSKKPHPSLLVENILVKKLIKTLL